MADKGGIQLLPETRKKIDVPVPGENRLIAAGGLLLVLVFVLWGGLYFYKSSLTNQVAALDDQIKAIEKERDPKTEEGLVTLDRQMAIISQLFSTHIFWSRGFNHIADHLQNRVQFESFSGTATEDKISFKARTDNYATLARQMASFVSDEAIRDVSLDNVTVLTSGTLEFNMTLTYDRNKFLK